MSSAEVLTPDKLMTKFAYRMVQVQPFYGNILCRLREATSTTGIETAAAGIDYILYNPSFMTETIAESGEGGGNFIYMHEFLHIVYGHSSQFKGKIKELYNVAADFVVNHTILDDSVLLKEIAMEVPKGALISSDPDFIRERTTNQLYEILLNQFMAQGGNKNLIKNYKFSLGKHSFDFPIINDDLLDRACSGESSSEAEEAREYIKDVLLGMEGQIGDLPAGMQREFDNYFGRKIKWYNWVKRFLNSHLSDDDSFETPDKNHLWRKILLPGKSFDDLGLDDIVVGIDTSGSISNKILGEFLFHFKDICTEFDVSGRVITWEGEVVGDTSIEEFSKNPTFKGGGGTNFCKFVDYVNKVHRNSKLMVVLTDGYFSIPEGRSRIPVLFIITKTVDRAAVKVLETYGKVCYL